MLNTTKTLKISGLILLASAIGAAPAYAQLGGVTGSVTGSVSDTVGSSTTVRTNVGVPDAKVRVPANARTGSRTYSGTHYHGRYAHSHGPYGYDHYHDTPHSHAHGYASVTVIADARDNRRDIGPMLTYGQKVESRKGKDLGRINSISRTESGMVTAVMVDGVPKAIPVDTLKADGDVLVTSKKKKELK